MGLRPGERNGTTVNLDPVDAGGQRLEHGDVLDIARLKFKVVGQEGQLLDPPADSDTLIGVRAPVRPFVHPRALARVIDERNVTIHYQPVVALDTEAVVGWEALGRVAVDGLPSNPTDLFLAATELGRASELSRILRAEAVPALGAPPPVPPALREHAAGEVASPAPIPGIADLVAAHPDVQLVLEVHGPRSPMSRAWSSSPRRSTRSGSGSPTTTSARDGRASRSSPTPHGT